MNEKILIFRTGQLGDTIVSIPALMAIKKHFPNSNISLLTDYHKGKNYVTAEAALPKGLIDNYIPYMADGDGISLINQPWYLLRAIRKKKYNKLIYLAPSSRRRFQIFRDLVLFRLLGIREVIGHKRKHIQKYHKNSNVAVNECDYLLNCIAQSGILVPDQDKRAISLELSKSEIAFAKNWLTDKIKIKVTNQIIIGIGPGSKAPSKVWPSKNYSELIKRMIAEFNVLPLIFGGPEDKSLGDQLINDLGIGVNTAGCLNVRQSGAILSYCKLYIGNDTGTMHLATAAGIPCLAIFSAQDIEGKWSPYGQKHTVLRRHVVCEGCKLNVCPKNNECLQKITVDEVLNIFRTFYFNIKASDY